MAGHIEAVPGSVNATPGPGRSKALRGSLRHSMTAGLIVLPFAWHSQRPIRQPLSPGPRLTISAQHQKLRMGKAAKTSKPSGGPDLFANLGEPRAASRRRGARRQRVGARLSRRVRLYRQAHRGAGGARAGAPPPRHVYRRHRRESAASPVRRGDRQFHGRGAGRPCRLDRGRDGGRRLRHRHRQRPRHSGRSASEIQEQVGARSDHVHAARRRQIRLQGLRDLGRPARRRRFGGERAVRAHGGRSRARPKALPDGVRARQAEDQIAGRRQGAEPARHQSALPARTRTFSAPRRTSSPSACSR